MTPRDLPWRQLTAIVPEDGGAARALAEALRGAGCASFSVATARGVLPGAKPGRRGAVVWEEMQVVQAVVPAERADEFFALMHATARIDQPGAGLLLEGLVAAASELVPPA